MPFSKGQGGRPRGSKNKRTIEFLELLEERGFDPGSAMISCYREAMKQYRKALKRSRSGDFGEDTHKFLKLAGDIAREIASYTYPKLKAIDHVIQEEPEAIDDAVLKDREDLLRAIFLEEAEKAGWKRPDSSGSHEMRTKAS